MISTTLSIINLDFHNSKDCNDIYTSAFMEVWKPRLIMLSVVDIIIVADCLAVSHRVG